MLTLQNQIRWCRRAQWALTSIIVVSLGAFYVMGYRPVTRQLSDLRSQIDELHHELSDAGSKAGVLPQVAQEVKTLRIKLEGSKKLPKENDLAQFIKDITQLSQQTSLKSFKYKPESPIRGDLFAQRSIKLTFDGDFPNVYSFIRQIESMQRLTRTPTAKITEKDGKPGMVSVELSMNLYFSPDD